MVFMDIIAVYCENNITHRPTYTIWEKGDFLMPKPVHSNHCVLKD
jgi:hypothetical protein